ncbi:hypothetical protein Tco_1059815 [Tanacetum coccineum]
MSCTIKHDYHPFWYDPKAIEELVNRRVEEALAAYEANRAANALKAESQSQNNNDCDNGNGGNANDGDGNRNGGNGNPNENERGARPVARECIYQDFMKCQPLNVKGTKGVVGLIKWFEKMETMFYISNYPEKYQVKYATCTLLNSALTWWNSHKRTVGTETVKHRHCGRQGHYRSDCPKLKDQNCGNKVRNKNGVGEARGKEYVLGGGEASPDSNVVKDEVLIVQGDRDGKGEKSKLSIISCTKTQKYIKRGCPIFLAPVTKKETEDKSEEKRLEDVLIVRDFLKVFVRNSLYVTTFTELPLFTISPHTGTSIVNIGFLYTWGKRYLENFSMHYLNSQRGKRCEKNYSCVRRYVADPDNAYPKRSITKLILKGAVIFDVVSYQF